MVRLELAEDEAQELSDAITAQLHVLRAELSAADIREFKHELRERLDLLEAAAARLAHEIAAAEAQAPDHFAPAG